MTSKNYTTEQLKDMMAQTRKPHADKSLTARLRGFFYRNPGRIWKELGADFITWMTHEQGGNRDSLVHTLIQDGGQGGLDDDKIEILMGLLPPHKYIPLLDRSSNPLVMQKGLLSLFLAGSLLHEIEKAGMEGPKSLLGKSPRNPDSPNHRTGQFVLSMNLAEIQLLHDFLLKKQHHFSTYDIYDIHDKLINQVLAQGPEITRGLLGYFSMEGQTGYGNTGGFGHKLLASKPDHALNWVEKLIQLELEMKLEKPHSRDFSETSGPWSSFFKILHHMNGKDGVERKIKENPLTLQKLAEMVPVILGKTGQDYPECRDKLAQHLAAHPYWAGAASPLMQAVDVAILGGCALQHKTPKVMQL